MHDYSFKWILCILTHFSIFDTIACGYNLPDEKIGELNKFLDEKKMQRIDLNTMLSTLTYLKELNLMNEEDASDNDYLDAFVALGG